MKNALSAVFQPALVRWRAMPVRDRRALAALGGFFSLVLAWLAVVSPAIDYAEDGRVAWERAQEDLRWMEANAAGARRAAASGRAAGGPGANGISLIAAINASAQAAGVTLQRFEPEGERRVRVTLENVSFTAVMRWLVGLERSHGLVVESFNADPQAQPGLVNIRLTLGRSA